MGTKEVEEVTVVEATDNFTLRCTRCREVKGAATWNELATMIERDYQQLGEAMLCSGCSPILINLREPYLDEVDSFSKSRMKEAYNIAIEEINQYHKDNPVHLPPKLLVVSPKGEVH